MHDLQFSDAARPAPVVILKLPLCDFSLGHELLLLQRRNALLLLSHEDFNGLQPDQQQAALLEAVWACSDPYSVTEKLNQPSFLGWRFRWRNFKARRWQRRFNEGDYPLAIAEFRNYLAAGRSLPPTPDPLDAAIAAGEAAPEAGGRAFGSPMLAGLINFISSRPLLFKSSVLDVPYSYATWLYFTEMESEGRIKIENQKEWEVRLETAQARAEALAEEEAEQAGNREAAAPEFTPTNPDLATPPPDLSEPEPKEES